MTVGEASITLFLLAAGIGTMSLSLISLFDGYQLQALALGLGGLYVVLWSGLRLTAAERSSP